MQLENYTNIPLSLSDLLDREDWLVEFGRDLKLPLKPVSLDGWKVVVRWTWGRRIWRGLCEPLKKRIRITINPRCTFPLTMKVAVGTERLSPLTYKYIFEQVTVNNAKELVRFAFLHEFSHALDYMQGLRLSYKETKANRFALTNLRKGELK